MASASHLAPYADAHAKPQGAGDARPTAIQIIKDQGLTGKLRGKVSIVTGGSSGIGIETARALHYAGADVYLTSRDMQKGEEIAKDIKSDGGPGRVEVLKLELDSLKSVRAAAEDFLSRSKTLNLLINNAGVMACPQGKTQDGFETQWGTNHLGHFLFFQLLKPALLASSTPEFQSRVVSVSSTGHRNKELDLDDPEQKNSEYNPWVAYSHSKTANIYLANEIERRYGGRGLHALSLHPGGIYTNLARHLPAEALEVHKKDPVAVASVKSPAQGAATSVLAAVAKEFEGRGGIYLEDCQESLPVRPNHVPSDPGHKPWAYDPAKEQKLWKLSQQQVGLPDDD